MKFIYLFLLLILSTDIFANEPFIIYGDIVDLETDGVISDEKINVGNTDSDLVDSLSRSTSIFVTQSGGAGQQSSIFLRGSGSGEFKVFLDGVDITDASSVNSSAFIEHFSTGLVESIDISKKSSLKKSINGGGGYINLNTAGREGTKPFSKLELGYGSYNTFKVNSSTLLNYGDYSSLTSVNYSNTDGLSIFKGGDEKDSYRNFSYLLKSQYHKKNKKISITFLHTSSKSEIDDSGADKINDDLSRFKQNIFSFQYANAFYDGFYWPTLTYSSQATQRETVQSFNSDRKSVKLGNIFKIDETNEAFMRVQFSKVNSDGLDSYNEYEAFSGYEKRLEKDRFFLGLGLYQAKEFGSNENFELLHEHKLNFLNAITEISVVKNLKTPSLFQLFDQTYGNKDLRAAKILSYEGSLSIWTKNILKLSLFEKIISNEIVYSSGTYLNAQKVTHVGAELEQLLVLSHDLDLRLSYSNTYSKNISTSSVLARRPREKMGIFINKKFTDRLNSSLMFRYTDSINDGERLPSYSLIDIKANYQINRVYSVSAKIGNVLNKDYVQIRDYTAPGRNVFVKLVNKL